MSAKFNNKYRIESARWRGYDYAKAGAYFVTVCTRDRIHYFGKNRQPNELAKVVEAEWLQGPILRPEMNLRLGEYIVMPNHFHGILIIGENTYNSVAAQNRLNSNITSPIEPDSEAEFPRDVDQQFEVPPHWMEPFVPRFDPPKRQYLNAFGPQSNNLASVMRGFKSAVTTYARIHQIPFHWQGRFHDHVIRDMSEFYRIERYILKNPANWKEDEFYKPVSV